MNCKLKTGVHTLFVGGNGKPTYGVLIERLEPRDEVEYRGYARVFPVNDYSILRGDLRKMDIPEAEAIEREICLSVSPMFDI